MEFQPGDTQEFLWMFAVSLSLGLDSLNTLTKSSFKIVDPNAQLCTLMDLPKYYHSKRSWKPASGPLTTSCSPWDCHLQPKGGPARGQDLVSLESYSMLLWPVETNRKWFCPSVPGGLRNRRSQSYLIRPSPYNPSGSVHQLTRRETLHCHPVGGEQTGASGLTEHSQHLPEHTHMTQVTQTPSPQLL
jgi:hypothetical protein